MSKNRKKAARKGAKSVAIKTKFKVGGRKSGKGIKQMSVKELNEGFGKCRPRDRFKFIREAHARIVLGSALPPAA